MQKTILLNGLYGVQNLGDDYILLSLVNRLKRRFGSELHVRVLSRGGDVSFLEEFGDRVEVVSLPSGKLGHALTEGREAWRNDVHLIGGGGLWPFESKKQMALQSLALHATRAGGGRTVFFGVEVNPPKTDWYKTAWRKQLCLADLFVGRNTATADAMRALAPDRAEAIHGLADVTYGLDDGRDEMGDKYGDGYVLWALAMPWSLEELDSPHVRKRYDLLVSQVREMIRKLSSVVDRQLFLPFYHDSDIYFIRDVTKEIDCEATVIEEGALPLAQKRVLFKHAAHAIVMRFHGVVFSIHEETPFTAIAYSPKITNILEENNLSDRYVKYGIRPTDQFYEEIDLDFPAFEEKVLQGFEDESLPNRVAAASRSCKRRAEEAYELLFSSIEGVMRDSRSI